MEVVRTAYVAPQSEAVLVAGAQKRLGSDLDLVEVGHFETDMVQACELLANATRMMVAAGRPMQKYQNIHAPVGHPQAKNVGIENSTEALTSGENLIKCPRRSGTAFLLTLLG